MEPIPYVPPLGNVMDLLVDAVCVVDAKGRFVFVSAASEGIFGYRPEELIGRNMIELVHPDDRERTLRQAGNIMAGTPRPHFENRYIRKDGRVVHIMWSARWSPGDGVRVAVARDITDRKRAETMQSALYAISEAAHAAADLSSLFKQVHRIVDDLLPARSFFVALHEPACDEVSFPYSVDAFEPRPGSAPFNAKTLCTEVIRRGQPVSLRSGDAAPTSTMPPPRPQNWLGVPLPGQNGCLGALVVQSDADDAGYTDDDRQLLQFVSTQVATAIERKQAETRLHHMARHDQLTDLPNRGLFRERLQWAMARAVRNGELLGLLYIDLDRFKHVNDHHGHAIGDLLLQEVACRVRLCLSENDTVGRLGGDEFAVLMPHLAQPEHAVAMAETIRQTLARPFELDGLSPQVAASIGVVLYPDRAEAIEDLLRQADNAMYMAKKRGGNRLHTDAKLPRIPG